MATVQEVAQSALTVDSESAVEEQTCLSNTASMKSRPLFSINVIDEWYIAGFIEAYL
jgi:hypothetical protein